MSELTEESKRVEHWLTGGKPRAVRTRGAVRVRGATASASGAMITRIAAVTELLEQLKADVPEVPWVVVVDGSVDAFAERVCLQVKNVRDSAKFWVVGSDQEIPQSSALVTLTPLRLNLQDIDDVRFLENLVVDLVILPEEPKTSQAERVRRWWHQTRYILAEALAASLLEELRMSELTSGSKAEICLIKGEA